MTPIESQQLLMVANAYELKDGKVIATGPFPQSRFYNPFEFEILPARLAEITEGDEKGVLSFVKEWGLLGYCELFTHRISAADRQAFDESFGEWGDPLNWIYSQAKTMRILFRLIELHKGKDTKKIGEYLQEIASDSDGHFLNNSLSYAAGPSLENVKVLGTAVTGEAEALSIMIINLINQNISDYISPKLAMYDRFSGALIRSHTTKALIPAIYSHLMGAAEGTKDYYQCAYRYCNKWSPVDSERPGPKSIYCSPKVVGESLCSRKERYHRKRNGESEK